MANALQREAIPTLNAGGDSASVVLRVLLGAAMLLWLAAGMFVWTALALFTLLLATLRLPFVLLSRLAGRRP